MGLCLCVPVDKLVIGSLAFVQLQLVEAPADPLKLLVQEKAGVENGWIDGFLQKKLLKQLE